MKVTNMWNRRVLTPPLYCEIKTTLKHNETGHLYQVRKFLKNTKESISDHMKLLTTEHYMVKRVIFKQANQMRSDKALKTLKQVNTCMKRLVGVDIEKQMRESIQLVERLPSSRDNTEYYLPSRQVLEYQLAILQGTGALLRQTLQYCQKSFIHVIHHLEIGNLVPQNLLMLALISRIWYVCNSLGLYVCKWYGFLHGCLAFFKPTTVPWLQNEELPKDLTAWLSNLFKETYHPEQKIMESVEAEKASGSLPRNVQFFESGDQEDIGEPIQRQTVLEESDKLQDKASVNDVNDNSNKRKFENNNDNDDEDIQTLRKKKPKVLISEEKTSTIVNIKKIDTMEGSDSDSSNLSEDEDSKLTEKHKSLVVKDKPSESIEDGLQTKLADINSTSVSGVKSHLEEVLQTLEDFDNFVEKIKSGTFKVSDTCVSLSKTGKKKILKNIDKWKNSMTDKNLGEKREQLFLKKVRGPLSQLIVKFNQISKEANIGKKTELNSDPDVDLDVKEGGALPEDSDLKRLQEETLKHNFNGCIGQQNTMKKKQKKERRKREMNGKKL